VLCFSCKHQPNTQNKKTKTKNKKTKKVGDLLLDALLVDEPGLQDDLGFVVDGFPRTAIQVCDDEGKWGGVR
jgi:hypothetical protein